MSFDPSAPFFDLVPDVLCVVGADGVIVRTNGAVSQLGYAPPQLAGRPLLELVHPEDVAPTEAALARAAGGGGALEVEHRLRCHDGSYRYIAWHGARDGAGTSFLVGRDVTARRAALESSALIDAILENLPHMVFLKDADTLSFARFNRAGEALLGLSRDSLLGKNDFDFFPREEAMAFQERDRETLRGDAVVDIPEEPIETKRGRRWLHTKKVPLRDAQGRPRYLLGISEDITELKEMAEARAEFQRALERERNAALAANQELEAFSYSVAHDLRAPLRSIDGFSRVLLDDDQQALNDKGKRYLSLVREAAQHMGRIIDDLLTLSRVTRAELRREPVDLAEAARAVIARLREASPDRRVDVAIPAELRAHGDPRLLGVLLENLLGNAWKFTGKRDAARIELATLAGAPDQPIVYVVRDDGAGFDQRFAGKLFGAFQRLHGASEFEGTGIGLATVHRIVARHGGRVWGEGKVGEGAAFYFTLGGQEGER